MLEHNPNGQDWDDWKKDWPMPKPPPYPADDEGVYVRLIEQATENNGGMHPEDPNQ